MIKITNVSKTYNKNKVEVKALQDITLNFPDKGLVFIVGKSGSGKSTLLNVIGGLDSFDEGDIIIENKSMKSFKEQDANNYRNSYVGFVFQDFNLINDYNLEKNIALGLNLSNTDEAKEQIKEVLEQVDLVGMEKRKPNTLSGGQKQRVAIARALVKRPSILLCDEPTGQLDYETGKSIFTLLKEISKDNLVVVISHDMESAQTYGDRIITLKDGKIDNDTKKAEEIKTDKEIELKKYKLSTKNSILLALGFFKKRPIRLMIALLISICSFTLFCVSDTLGSYDRNKVIVDTLYDNQNDYISFQKRLSGTEIDDSDSLETYHLNMSDDDIGYLMDKLPIDNYQIVYDVFDSNNYGIGGTNNSHIYNYYDNIAGITELSDELINQYQYKLYGKKPTNDNEVVITKYVYELYKKYGYKEDNNIIKIESMDNLIGRTIGINGDEEKYIAEDLTFTITGILDTNFNNERYKEILLSKDKELAYKYEYEISNIMKCGLHNVLFVREGFYQDNIVPLKKVEDDIVELGEFRLSIDYTSSVDEAQEKKY